MPYKCALTTTSPSLSAVFHAQQIRLQPFCQQYFKIFQFLCAEISVEVIYVVFKTYHVKGIAGFYDAVIGWMKRRHDYEIKKEWIIPPAYQELYWKGSYYVAYIQEGRKKQKCGLTDPKGQVLIPFDYDYLMPSRTEDLISAKKRGRYLFINSKNERIKLF